MQLHVPGQITLTLPDQLLRNLHEVHGRGRVDRWIEELPAVLERTLATLGACMVPGEPPLSYHLVFFARCDGGGDIVVKCTVPNADQPPEVAAVRALSDARIGPRLLSFDGDQGVLVMDRVLPGSIMPTDAPSLARDAAISRAVAGLAARMASEVDVSPRRDELVPVRQYSRALSEVDPSTSLWREHRAEIESALDMRDRLIAEYEGPGVFLHGDLHHYNVLRTTSNGWTVIDPKGLVGPPGYEFGAFTYNPVNIQHHPGLAAIERQRVAIWSEVTGVPWETVRSWGYVAAVLSACWSGEGGGIGWQDAMKVALTLRGLTPLG